MPNDGPSNYDAFLFVSFGGPEGPGDVLPFLENVLRGKNVPHERMLEVAQHYQQFEGISPINEQNRRLIAALEAEFTARGSQLPIYWGNRNWHPLLADTLQQMADEGVKRAIAFFTSAYSSYSSCRQYQEDIARAQSVVGPRAPQVDKLRVFFNHPGFVEPMVESVVDCLRQIPEDQRNETLLLFSAHSIPQGMSENCQYVAQLQEACRLVAEGAGHANWELVYQSRSGPPQQPWLEPDICDRIEALHKNRALRHVVVLPIGFISDHLEVLYDLDTEARQLCERLSITMHRAATVGTHPRFVQMIGQLLVERMSENPDRLALGCLGPSHDVCPADCCSYQPQKP
ncbi:MAG: ferrochelatase [Planctomycetes bacterium]|nr:ferrochelatase [Planctomycetota bacterium]